MKVYAINDGGGVSKRLIFKTKKLATEYLLKIEPTCKRQNRRSKFSGCEVYDNCNGKTFCISTLNIIEKLTI